MPVELMWSHTARARTRRVRWMLLVALLASQTPLAAQTLFRWPDLTVHLERYATVDECLAAVGRVRRAEAKRLGMWSDTVAMTPEVARAALPAAVSETARICGARYTVETAADRDFLPLVSLYLLAGRDADAATLADRRLKAVPAKAELRRGGVLDTLIGAYLGGGALLAPQPARLEAAEPLVMELGSLKAVPWRRRLSAFNTMALMGARLGDTTRARRAARAVIETVHAIPSAERRSDDYASAIRASFYVSWMLREEALLDSLRRSSASYIAMRQRDWQDAGGTHDPSDSLDSPIGRRAPPIQADFWFRRGDSTASRPVHGKVSLVGFLDHAECHAQPICFRAYAMLRRVGERYPALDVTVVARTRGHITDLAPPTPAEEAETIRHWWHDVHGMPGALAVTTTDFWRLPEPDRRRVDRDRPNETNYSFGRYWPVAAGTAFLVDREGAILSVIRLDGGDQEVYLGKLLGALIPAQDTGR